MVLLHQQYCDARHLLHGPWQTAEMIAVQPQLPQLHHISEREGKRRQLVLVCKEGDCFAAVSDGGRQTRELVVASARFSKVRPVSSASGQG